MEERHGIGFKYYFIPMGSRIIESEALFTIESTEAGAGLSLDRNNTVILDVGNALKKGIIDHHHLVEKVKGDGVEYRSTTGILAADPGFIEHVADCKEVNIVVHNAPDLDCITAAYLVQEYVANGGRLPEYCRVLADYVEKVDSGMMQIENNNCKVPFAVIYAIEEVLKKEENSEEPLNTRVLKRGIRFISCLMERYKNQNGGSKSLGLNNTALLENMPEFGKELEILENDYKIYLSERDNPEICIKRKLRLPKAGNGQEELKETDGLFWRTVPCCKLNKYWARQDRTAPGGKGYVLTFIPVYIDLGYNSEKYEPGQPEKDKRESVLNALRNNNYENIDDIRVNRVIISVDPNSDVTLAGLGYRLEQAELAAEGRKFGDRLKGIWRDRSSIRFNDLTLDNADPWYDGRGFGYTIVDAPNAGSLLSLEELEEITLDYLKTVVIENTIRFVIPFSYRPCAGKSMSLPERIRRSGKVDKPAEFKPERVEYFIEYIQKYYFNAGEAGNSNICTGHFLLKDNIVPQIQEALDSVELCVRREETRELGCLPERPVSIKVRAAAVTAFIYGTGFVIIDCGYEPANKDKSLFMEDVMECNRIICGSEEIHNRIVRDLTGGESITVEKPLVYILCEADPDTLRRSEKAETVYKLCNIMKWDDPFTKSDYFDEVLKRSCFEASEFATYGFSKNGYAVMVGARLGKGSSMDRKLEHIKQSFMERDFDIFMLSLHQRNTLMHFSTSLSGYWTRKDKKGINLLRDKIMDFTTLAWFSQITKNEMGAYLYNKWNGIFDNKALYDEVYGQVCSMDDYYKLKANDKYQWISVILLPVVVLGGLVETKVIDIAPLFDLTSYSGYGWGWIAAVLLAMGMGIYLYFNKRD